MKHFFIILLVLLFTPKAWSTDIKVPAFPEAEGFGAFTMGGRGGKVYLVSTTDDYDHGEPVIPGSLREAVEAEGPRMVIFRVSGLIELKRRLILSHPYITIAGQTAPGDGICIKDEQFIVSADEVIIRHIRFRPGDRKKRDIDAVSVRGENIIFDHCSAGWSIDENLSAYSNSITIQNCIISEGLYRSYHPKGIHSMGSIVNGQYGGISLIYNIYAHNYSRNPVVQNVKLAPGAIFEIRNNVIYNWGQSASYVSGVSPVRVNMMGNYFKPGLTSLKASRRYAFSTSENTRIFMVDNFHTENEEASLNNWLLLKRGKKIEEKRMQAFPYPKVALKKGQEIYEEVLNEAGATLPSRDAVDRRIVNDVRKGTGIIIDSQEDVGGWPVYATKKAPKDRDMDGMPDVWEKKYGLDSKDPSDHKADADMDGYTNIEEFINSTNPITPTSSNLSHSEFLAVLASLDTLNIHDYKMIEEKEARRLAALANRSLPELNIKFIQKPGDKPEKIELLIDDKVKIAMNMIPAGTFVMGSPEDEAGREQGETLHRVTLSSSYYMGITEVTNQQFSEVVKLIGRKN